MYSLIATICRIVSVVCCSLCLGFIPARFDD